MKETKIKSISYYGKMPVYNMEVEKYENYSCENGKIVHNCYDSAGYGLISYHSSRSVLDVKADLRKMTPDMLADYRSASKQDRKLLIKKWGLIKK